MTLTDSTFSANSTNIITDTYTWSGTVHLAANVTLIFQGGKLIGGTLQGNNTVIQAPCSQIFSNVQFTGTFVVENWNACWFGCVGDGTTNNTTALQYAINALYSLSEQADTQFINNDTQNFLQLYFPYGRFRIGSQINIPPKCAFRGSGDGSKIIVDYNGNGFIFNNSGTYTTSNGGCYLGMFDLSFMGTRVNHTSCVLFSNTSNTHMADLRVSRCRFSNFSKVFDTVNGYWTRMSDCEFILNSIVDLNLGHPNSCSISNCGFRDSAPNSIIIQGEAAGISVTGCDFSGATSSPIILKGSITDAWITGNYFEPTNGTPAIVLGTGLFMDEMKSLVIKGNYLGEYCYIKIDCRLMRYSQIDGQIYVRQGYSQHAASSSGNTGHIGFVPVDDNGNAQPMMKTASYHFTSLSATAQQLIRDVFDSFVESEDMWGTKIYVDQANWSLLS